uniref:polyamine-modulated factor 1 n=1 Tax=Euleptes europaea TaxID=460621 RepID=UPI0025413563|nr:polyamine-modulated factor 1 [Euleptes europaea]
MEQERGNYGQMRGTDRTLHWTASQSVASNERKVLGVTSTLISPPRLVLSGRCYEEFEHNFWRFKMAAEGCEETKSVEAKEADDAVAAFSSWTTQEESGREQVFNLVVNTLLEKMEEVGSYKKFASCYNRLYKVQPELTRRIYDQYIYHLQTSFREEIGDLKEEGNLEALFKTLDKLVEEAKQREAPAWRPSGIPEQDVRSAVAPYLLKQRRILQKNLKEKEEGNARLAEAVLAGRKKIADLQKEIQKRKEEWQMIAQESREMANTLDEHH